MTEKKILYIDMDNVVVDFASGIERVPKKVMDDHVAKAGGLKDLDDIPGIFSLMDPLPNAIDSVLELAELFDTYLLSSSPWNNPSAWADKIKWVHLHLGQEKTSPLYKRLILSHHKNLNDGHFLVDDRLVNGAEKFGLRQYSEHIHFGQNNFEDWTKVLPYLRERA